MGLVFNSPISNSQLADNSTVNLFRGLGILAAVLGIGVFVFFVAVFIGIVNVSTFILPVMVVIFVIGVIVLFKSASGSGRTFQIKDDGAISIAPFVSPMKANPPNAFYYNQYRTGYLGIRLELSKENVSSVRLIEMPSAMDKIGTGNPAFSLEEAKLMKYIFNQPSQKSLLLSAKEILFHTSAALNIQPKKFQNVEFLVSVQDCEGAFETLKKMGFPTN